jgi:hypothetical protein
MANQKSDAGAILKAKVFVGETHRFEDGSGTFSPTSSTLIMGETDAVLVDAQHIRSDVQALSDIIAQTGKRLTTIYVTHGHAVLGAEHACATEAVHSRRAVSHSAPHH